MSQYDVVEYILSGAGKASQNSPGGAGRGREVRGWVGGKYKPNRRWGCEGKYKPNREVGGGKYKPNRWVGGWVGVGIPLIELKIVE